MADGDSGIEGELGYHSVEEVPEIKENGDDHQRDLTENYATATEVEEERTLTEADDDRPVVELFVKVIK